MYQIIKKLVRPGVDTPWPDTLVTMDPQLIEHFKTNHIETGKHIFRNTDDHKNGLERTLTVLWETKEAWEEFEADPLMTEMRNHVSQLFKDAGITEEIVSFSEI